jgi:hypothetical protein
MRNRFAIVATCVLTANAIVPPPAIAQADVKFYCGQSYNPLSKTHIPTTLVAVPGREKPVGLIQWKSEYFSQYTPQKRCEMVSPKFQAAYTAGKLSYFATGKHRKTGQNIVCGLASAEETCEDDSNLLFTLKPYSSGKLVLSQLMGIREGKGGGPIPQSSGEREVVDVQAFLNSSK